jgi:hypothetical protein
MHTDRRDRAALRLVPRATPAPATPTRPERLAAVKMPAPLKIRRAIAVLMQDLARLSSQR